MSDIRELLPLYALGVLDPDDVRAVERALAADPMLAAEAETFRDAATDLITPIAPPPDLQARLLASVGVGRFERMSSRMAKVFDLTVDRVRELLGLAEQQSAWENPMPGLRLIHFSGGPAYPVADCGFIRLAPGCTFPWHKHRGEEVSIILTGTLRDHEGRIFRPGDEWVQAEGTAHEITAQGDEECIFVARAINGIEVGPRT